jgi:hypothetical protein
LRESQDSSARRLNQYNLSAKSSATSIDILSRSQVSDVLDGLSVVKVWRIPRSNTAFSRRISAVKIDILYNPRRFTVVLRRRFQVMKRFGKNIKK